MRPAQKTVAIGAASGIVSMIVLVVLLYNTLPSTSGLLGLSQKLAYALRLNVIALIPFFIMIASVGNSRFLSKAINPLDHAENQTIEVDGRVADNTLQQNFVFFVGTMALSTFLSEPDMKLVLALVITFIIARLAFWIGYRMNPLYRAPGMAATSYMNLGIILFILYRLFL